MKSETKEPFVAGARTRTVTVKVTIGHAKFDSKQPAVSPERVAEELAITLRLLRDNYFGLTGQEMSWEFPFWAKSLNG